MSPDGTGVRLPWLHERLARRVLLPLAAVWLAGTLLVLAIASHFTAVVFDRALLDDALGLAASVSDDGQGLQVDLTASELRAVLFDQSETVQFVVRAADGRVVAGDGRLRLDTTGDGPHFADLGFDGQALRAVALRRSGPPGFDLVLAQTTHNRAALRHSLLLYSAVPQALLLLALGLWLRRTLRTDLQPVVALQQELDQRGSGELQALQQRGATADTQALAAAIDALMARLAAALQAQREFSGNVAHELRTPLAGIRALVEYGLAQHEPAVWREQLEAVRQSEHRASHLVDQLLALALADEAPQPGSQRRLALDELVQRVLLQVLPRADAAGVDLGAQGIDEPVWVQGDEGLVEGVLHNLLDNALRHGRPDDGTVAQVTVQVQREGRTVRLAVEDNGPGMAADERERLRERWQRGGAARQSGVPGTGLGLAIVARYAERLGATLEIGSGPAGRGSSVGLRLPMGQ